MHNHTRITCIQNVMITQEYYSRLWNRNNILTPVVDIVTMQINPAESALVYRVVPLTNRVAVGDLIGEMMS